MQNAYTIHAAVGLRIGLIRESLEKKMAEAEAAGYCRSLETAYEAADRVLLMKPKPEAPILKTKKTEVVNAVRSVVLQANAWADAEPDRAKDAFYLIRPVEAWKEEMREKLMEAQRERRKRAKERALRTRGGVPARGPRSGSTVGLKKTSKAGESTRPVSEDESSIDLVRWAAVMVDRRSKGSKKAVGGTSRCRRILAHVN